CALASGQFASPRSGWLIYQSDTGWNFRMYNQNGTATSVNITGGPAPVAGTWHHVVAVYDGTTALVYVNGVQAVSGTPTGYVPSAGGPLFIGGRSDSSFWWNGSADELAIYGKALTASEIDAHYKNGISASPATSYNQLVLNSGPLGYYRLNEPAFTPPTTLPVAKNLGSSGAANDGSYNPGADAQAGGPRPPTFSGFEADNTAGGFNGSAGYVGTPFNLNDLTAFTVMGWLKRGVGHSGRGGYFGQNDLLEFGDADNGANIEAWINAYGTNIKIPYPFRDDEWGLITLVGDSTQTTLYTNGAPASTITRTVDSFGNSSFNFNIGGGGIFNAAGDYFLGAVDEVAVFDKALTATEVQEIYYSANIAPVITTQPTAPSRELFEGNTVTLSVAAAGTPPLFHQWRKGGADLAGKTSADLLFSNITVADSGTYDVVVRNSFGTVTSASVTLTVKPADRTPPTLQYATGNRTSNGVRVWFSEALDPASAQTASNYQLSDGVTVTSATLSAPAGSPGDNIVDLVTSAQTPGRKYTLTVNGVKDQTAPGNPIAAGSTIQFSSWVVLTGQLNFEHYDNISGAADSDIARGLQDPRVIAGRPTTAGFISGRFDTRTVFPNDSHEFYLARMTGWITPAKTADYYFFLRADDAARLYLSANETIPNPATDTPICAEPDCCDGFYEPDSGDPATTATPITLQAGKRYGVLALLKEHGGGDWMMVAWRETTDATAAADLPYLPGQYLSTVVDPNADLLFVKQPTDQLGTVASAGVPFVVEDFNTTDGGFTVETVGDVPGPWFYDPAGVWQADSGNDGCGQPNNSSLNSPAYTMTQGGALTLTFKHRYSFEPEYDGGQVRISVNGGAFAAVPPGNFRENGYWDANLIGNGVLLGNRAFNGNSAGYASGTFITSVASLGTFKQGDKIAVQFLGAWDECAIGTVPNWVVDSFRIDLLPMIIQDFSVNDGGYTAETVGTPPGPFAYNAAKGAWIANSGNDACGSPNNSSIKSPAYVVPQDDEVTLSFSHRYSFESGLYDAGQVQISVNGGPYTAVAPENFSANGYADGLIVGNGVLIGKRGFNGDSPGYAATNYITSTAILGNFKKNDTISIKFLAAWDECSIGSGLPSWTIKNVTVSFGKAAKASTFDAAATATLRGDPLQVAYQWQRNDGAGFVDIPNANTASFRIFPTPADLNAKFRVVVSVVSAPMVSLVGNEVKLLASQAQTPPEISIAIQGGQVKVTFTGTLQSAPNVAGTYSNVPNAVSPYTVTGTAATMFYRSVK
ncbi:MAG: LamG-like jellyroll fold domain-containing protein, partial [Verrucomicrobiota bacterium]